MINTLSPHTMIDLTYTFEGRTYNQAFPTYELAITELKSLPLELNASLLIDEDGNWNTLIKNNLETYYIAKEGDKYKGCKSGWFGTLGYYEKNR